LRTSLCEIRVMLSLTIFKNLYDNKTNKRMDFESWAEFESLLYKLSEVEFASKKDAYLISPAVFKPDTTRANKNVIEWAGWAAVDVDDYEMYNTEGDIQSELFTKFGRFHYVCYSTASSDPQHPKFRLVFPLSESVEADRIKHFWYALNTELGSIGDRQTKDLSRMYFIPGSYSGAFNFIFSNAGSFISPEELMAKHPYVEKTGNSFMDKLPPEMQKSILEYRKAQMTNTDVYWTGYQDCPFFPKRLANEYKTLTSGWYHKMYQIMVATASQALKKKYPITAQQIAILAKQLDTETGNWYESRPLDREAENALEYAFRNVNYD